MALVLRMLDTYQAQPNALLCADEVFCGRAPHRGTETCAVVEALASLEQAFSVLGEPALMDRVETLAFNALPAALTADMWTHVYVQQANSVFAGHTSPEASSGEVDPSRRAHHLHYRHQPNEFRNGVGKDVGRSGRALFALSRVYTMARHAARTDGICSMTRRPVKTKARTTTACPTFRAASPTSRKGGQSSRHPPS